MKQKGQILIFVLIVALIMAIAGGAYYLGKQVSPKSSPAQVVTPQTPQSIVIPSPAPDETANWKTYKNIKYGYSIKHPSDWKIKPWCFGGNKEDEYTCLLSPDFEYNPGQNPVKQGGSISMGSIDESLDYGYTKDKFCESTPIDPILECKEIMVGSLKGLQRSSPYEFIDIGILKDGKTVFTFRVNYIPESKNTTLKTFDQILSTFKFTQ